MNHWAGDQDQGHSLDEPPNQANHKAVYIILLISCTAALLILCIIARDEHRRAVYAEQELLELREAYTKKDINQWILEASQARKRMEEAKAKQRIERGVK